MSTPSNTTQSLIDLLLDRDARGQAKYHHTLDRTDLLCEDWAQHAIEESLDRAGYLLRVAQTAAELRAENIRLAEENLRLRSMILPFLELAKTLEIDPAPQAEAIVVETPVLNILTDDKMLSPVPSVSEPMPEAPAAVPTPTASAPVGMTAREIAAATGYHKDSVNNWGRAGLLPEPVPGTGGHPHNPPRYVVDMDELLEKVKARQVAAMSGKARKPAEAHIATPPEPAFDVNEEGRYEAIEHGRSFFRPDKAFDLWRICTPSGYKWRVTGKGQSGIGVEGGEVVEHWKLNGLGQWESANVVPGMVGTGNGVTKGTRGYTVPVLG
jgi:hypothetical protein